MTVCLYCGATGEDEMFLEEHFDGGLCKGRVTLPIAWYRRDAFVGELVEGADGVLRPLPTPGTGWARLERPRA